MEITGGDDFEAEIDKRLLRVPQYRGHGMDVALMVLTKVVAMKVLRVDQRQSKIYCCRLPSTRPLRYWHKYYGKDRRLVS
jgi:hypothetical protein